MDKIKEGKINYLIVRLQEKFLKYTFTLKGKGTISYWKTSGPKTAANEVADQISSWCDATLAKNLHRNFNKL